MKNLNYEFEKINNLNKIECIAFDIFDTIVTRDVNPEYVKKIWSKEMANKLNISGKEDLIYKLRSQLEYEICHKNESLGYDLEFKFEEMLENLYRDLKSYLNINKEVFIHIGVRLEIETELRVQSVDEVWLDFVKKAREKEIRIICISDFYLSSENISEIFKSHDILKYIDKVYTSSDFLLTKRSGRLYKNILESEHIESEKILMVGDNKHSDYNKALEAKMNAYHINRIEQHNFYKQHDLDTKIKKDIVIKVENLFNVKKQTYFDNAAYSLYSFIDLLYSKLLNENVKNIFFLSREGEFLKILFDEYRKSQNYKGNQFIKSHYLIVSRKSTFLPSLKELGEENFENLFRQYRKISVYDFLSSLNFEEKIIYKFAQKLDIDTKNKEEDFPTSQVFNKLKSDTEFISYYNEIRIEQNLNFKKYIKQYNIDIEEEGLNIVDVGWKGTIQDNIFNIFNGKIKINGYYTGLISSGSINEMNLKNGVLFNNIEGKSLYFDVFNENRALFEMLLAASHGSANGYKEEDGVIIALTHEEKEEKYLYENTIKGIQSNIFLKFKEILNLYSKTTITYNEYGKLFAKKHAEMVFYPTNKEIEFFRKMYHFENFGVFEFTTFNKSKIDTKERLNNIKTLILNPKEIMSRGFWGPITLEDQGLGKFKRLYGHYRMKKNFGGRR